MIREFLDKAVELRDEIRKQTADVCAKALCYGVHAPATQAAKDQLDAALDEQLIYMLLADDEYAGA